MKETDPDIEQLAVALNSLVTQLEERNLQLRALSQRAINAQEEERRRIALSLHDDTGQALTMLIIHLDRIENRLTKDQVDLKAKLAFARKLASDTLEELRKIIFGLRPAILDDLGLVPAIRWYARSNLEPHGIQVKVVAPEEQNLPDELTTTLFRISQETINNIARHSQAHTATISLLNEKERVLLKVNDDGLGFDVNETTGQALRLEQLGLLGIQERAELVGGEVTVESAPGKGTEIQVIVPLITKGDGQNG